jgi:hypothetical protein
MVVVVHLASVDSHPQSDPLFGPVRRVVRAESLDKRTGQSLYEQRLGHIRRGQDEHTIATVFILTVSPRDTSRGERLMQGSIQALTHGDLVRVSPSLIAKSFDVHNKDRPMHGWSRLHHQTSHDTNEPPRVLCRIRMPLRAPRFKETHHLCDKYTDPERSPPNRDTTAVSCPPTYPTTENVQIAVQNMFHRANIPRLAPRPRTQQLNRTTDAPR